VWPRGRCLPGRMCRRVYVTLVTGVAPRPLSAGTYVPAGLCDPCHWGGPRRVPRAECAAK